MNMAELRDGWNRLSLVYSNMPAFSPPLAEEWLRVLAGFSTEEFTLAIDRWIDKRKYRPVPAEMAEYCYDARRRIAADRRRNQTEEACPYCGGSGFVNQLGRLRGPGVFEDVVFPCRCSSSPRPETGARIIAEAEEDPRWAFDPHLHAFRRRTEWIGEHEFVSAAEAQREFEKATRQLCSAIGG